MFSVHTTPEEFNNATITGHFGFVFEKYSGREIVVFKKLRFQNVFCPRENEKPAFSNSSGLKSVFEKVGNLFNRRPKAAFSNSTGVMRTGPWAFFYCAF